LQHTQLLLLFIKTWILATLHRKKDKFSQA
jgi:hypothetical protein